MAGRITTLFVRKVLAQTHPSVDQEAQLEALGLDAEALADPARMITDAQYYGFLEALAAVDPEVTTLPLRTGASMRLDEYGALGLAMKSAVSLRGTYERAVRYALVLTNVATYELQETDEGTLVILHREGARRLGLRLSNEATIASLVSIGQQVRQGGLQPLEVWFEHPPPSSSSAHEAHFGCPVRFGAEHDAFLASPAALAGPNHLGDPGISGFMDAHLEKEVTQLKDDLPFVSVVRSHVQRALSEGVPTVTATARQVGLSGRTLQRRLAEEGTSYQEVVDEARRELAVHLVGETSYALTEVAFLTGFSEQSALTRAFKRWVGSSPKAYRLEGQDARTGPRRA